MAGRVPCLALVILCGCSKERLNLSPVWTESETALVIVTDGDDHPLIDRPIEWDPDRPIELEVRLEGDLRVYANVYGATHPAPKSGAYFGGLGESFHPDRVYLAVAGVDGDFQATSPNDRFDIRGPELPTTLPVCRGVEMDRFAFPQLRILTSVLIRGDRVYVGGGDADRTHAEIHRLVGDTLELVHRFDASSSWVVGLDWDGSSIWAPTAGGQLAKLSDDGTTRFEDAGMARTGLSIGRDGSIFSWGAGGVLEHTRTATLGLPRPELTLSNMIRGVEVRTADEILLFDEIAAYTWKRGNLTLELERVQAELQDIQSDADRTLIISRNLGAILRGASGVWEEIGHPQAGFPLCGVLLPRGLMVAGQRGASSLWIDGRWCAIEPSIQETISQLAATPDGRTVYAVGELVDGGVPSAILYRLRIPIDP